MPTKYIFYVPPNEKFDDVLCLPPLPSTIIEQRVYTPKEPVTNVTHADYIVLCVDMDQICKNEEQDADYNLFLGQCTIFGNHVSVLVKGEPKEVIFQKWNARKGKQFLALEETGRLWGWEAISAQGSGPNALNKLQCFQKAVEKKTKRYNLKVGIILAVAVVLILVTVGRYFNTVKPVEEIVKYEDLWRKEITKSEEATKRRNEEIAKSEEAIKYLRGIRTCLKYAIGNYTQELEELQTEAQIHKKVILDKNVRKHLNEENLIEEYNNFKICEDMSDFLHTKIEECNLRLNIVEDKLELEKQELVVYIDENKSTLDTFCNK